MGRDPLLGGHPVRTDPPGEPVGRDHGPGDSVRDAGGLGHRMLGGTSYGGALTEEHVEDVLRRMGVRLSAGSAMREADAMALQRLRELGFADQRDGDGEEAPLFGSSRGSSFHALLTPIPATSSENALR